MPFEDSEVSDSEEVITVMLVEDDPLNRLLISIILKQIYADIHIIEAENGQRAIEEFKETIPNLIIMDIQMPIMNGYEATSAIRKLEGGDKVPIIGLTAGSLKGDREKCIASGMSDYASKPVVIDTIEKIIDKWLNANRD
ncbi:MAG: response regulator [Balneolales bacterium]